MLPTIGRIVYYRLTEADATAINKRRADFDAYRRAIPEMAPDPGEPGATGHMAHVGNHAAEDDVYPALIVRVFEHAAPGCVNLQVHLDGTDTYWATSRYEGDQPGHWTWPPRV
jgi:hypothetical protein